MIRVEQLSLELAGRRILQGVSFAVAQGECMALVGPNGCGKTSVLRCLLGLVPYQGRATIGGFDAWSQPLQARGRLGYLPQRPAFGSATAREVLSFAADLRRVPRSRIQEVLVEVGLEAHADAPARSFSGGMQQRLSFGLTLLSGAEILLLDEPTASLDREGQRTFLEVARELKRAGRTMLLASHRSEEIGQLADRVLTLAEGRVVPAEEGAAGDPPGVLPLFSPGARRCS